MPIMKIYAVISEFNPFHNGHKYLIDTVKSGGDSAVVAIMSGSLVERGDVSVIDKYARAEAAIKCGCDLVLELPAPWSFAGAEFFALGGVGIAEGIGVCHSLAFGSESGDSADLVTCAKRLASAEYATELLKKREEFREKNTATLRAEVYSDLYGHTDIFDGSNNLLALEYLHALETVGSKITPVTVKRWGGDFNDEALSEMCSASAIRRAVYGGESDFYGYMPEESREILCRELAAGRLYRLSRLDTAIVAMLRTTPASDFGGIMEVSGGIEFKLQGLADTLTTASEIVEAAKERRFSASRLRRVLLSMMLSVKTSDVETPPLFTTVLGANEVGRSVLAAMRDKSKIAVLSKLSDSSGLSGKAYEQFSLYMRAERLAELCCEGEPRRIGALMF